MSHRSRPRAGAALGVLFAFVTAIGVASSPAAAAGGPNKEECLEAHSKGQDARQSGQLSLARKLFVTCAQPTCPGMVQGDCARFTDELDRLQPTATFAARERSGADLPDTAVYIDGILVATRLDDGKVHDVDPGTHTVRFQNAGRDVSMTVVFNQGEKGRVLSASFGGAPASPSQPAAAPAAEPPSPSRPLFPLVVAGGGVALMITGGVLGAVGMQKVPSSCSLSSHTCLAPPNDPVFTTAQNGVTLADVGLGVGIGGAVLAATGLVWYFTSSPRMAETATQLAPWAAPGAAGLSVRGAL